MNQSEDSFVHDIEKNISYVNKVSNLISNGQITPELLNESLAKYIGVNTFLISIYEQTVLEDETLKDEWKLIWSEWFIKAKNNLNDSRVSSKFASATEIEAHALVDNREEYLSWKKKLNLSERKVSMYRRIVDSWKVQSQILVQISNNLRSELSALSIENRANKNITREKIIRKVKQKDDNGISDDE